MKAIYTAYEPTYSARDLHGNFYKTKARTEKRVRFAEDCSNTDSNPSLGSGGLSDPQKSITKSGFDSYYRRKLQGCATNDRGLRREQTFSFSPTNQRTCKEILDGIRRKQCSDFARGHKLYAENGTHFYETHERTASSKQAFNGVVSPELQLGARSFTTLLDDVLRSSSADVTPDIPRFSRYRPVAAYSATRKHDVMTSPRSARYSPAISLRNSSGQRSNTTYRQNVAMSPRTIAVTDMKHWCYRSHNEYGIRCWVRKAAAEIESQFRIIDSANTHYWMGQGFVGLICLSYCMSLM